MQPPVVYSKSSSVDNKDHLYAQREIHFFFPQPELHGPPRETVLFRAGCVLLYVCTVPVVSSNNQFLGVVDALEWWRRKSSDTQPSRNESIKWLPGRNCYIFKCLWEYLPSPFTLPLAHFLANTWGVSLWLMLSVFWLRHGARWCEMALWSCRMPILEIPLSLLKILPWDLQFLDGDTPTNGSGSAAGVSPSCTTGTGCVPSGWIMQPPRVA